MHQLSADETVNRRLAEPDADDDPRRQPEQCDRNAHDRDQQQNKENRQRHKREQGREHHRAGALHEHVARALDSVRKHQREQRIKTQREQHRNRQPAKPRPNAKQCAVAERMIPPRAQSRGGLKLCNREFAHAHAGHFSAHDCARIALQRATDRNHIAVHFSLRSEHHVAHHRHDFAAHFSVDRDAAHHGDGVAPHLAVDPQVAHDRHRFTRHFFLRADYVFAENGHAVRVAAGIFPRAHRLLFRLRRGSLRRGIQPAQR